MLCLGIDMGSCTVKGVLLQDGVMTAHYLAESGCAPQEQALNFLKRHPEAQAAATGRGRCQLQQHAPVQVIAEIEAHALGARHLFPRCRTILDVGSDNCTVMALDDRGGVRALQMNEGACIGAFMETMALSLGYRLDAFGAAAESSWEEAPLTSMCAACAESEVVSLRSRGVPAADIARRVHLAAAKQLAGMVCGTGCGTHLFFSGGVANNRTLVRLLELEIGVTVVVPQFPEVVGALGAALHAASLPCAAAC